MTIPDDMNELTDVNINRVDLVGRAANGTRFLLAKSADGPNLLDADAVRGLLKEADATAVEPDLSGALETITKAGRALSSANETALRNAAESIQKVLASLPAPEEAPIEKETPVAEETTEETPVEKDAAETVEAVDAAPENVEKAEPLMAVYDATGKLVGVIKPNSLTPIDAADPGTEDVAEEATETPAEEAAEEAGFAESAEDEVQPDDGAPAESVTDDEAVIPGTETVQSPIEKATEPENVTQAPDVAALLKEALAPLVEKIADAADLANEVKVLKERVEAYGREPDDRKSPVLNGATGTAGIAKRAADDTDELATLAKSVEIAKEAGDYVSMVNAQQAYAFAATRARFTN